MGSEELPGAEGGDDLVEHEVDLEAITELPDASRKRRVRNVDAGRLAADRLHDEREHLLRSDAFDHGLERRVTRVGGCLRRSEL